MFGTPTSTVSSMFDIIRSPPSVSSHSHHKNKESIGVNAASGVLNRPSKSSPSISSFNSSGQYQPSSCSTYSPSTPAVVGSNSDIFKRQYVTQAIRLVDDALMEQEKGSCCDESYAFDCYLASLEYLLSAVSTETNLFRQIGSVDRQEIIHAKLINLIRCTEEFSGSNQEYDSTSTSRPTKSTTGWWNGVLARIDSSKSAQESSDVFISTPSELAAQCDCGRKILVKIPEYFLPDPLPDRHPEISNAERRGFFVGAYIWIFNLIYTAISIINGFILPSLISFFIRTTLAFVVYIEKRFDIVNLILNFFVSMIKLLLKISQDYNFNKQIVDFFSWLISKMVKIALAFVKSDDIKNMNLLFDLSTIENNNEDQDFRKNLGDVNARSHSFQRFQPQIIHQSNNKFTGGSTSSSSRFSMKSDSTYQINHKDHKPSPVFTGKYSNASIVRTRRNNF